jgi:hypothetical protein
MSYKTDIADLRDTLKVLNYRLIPNVLDVESEDVSTSFEDMGYTLIPFSILDEDVTNGSTVGTRLYRLQTTYKAKNEKEYDDLWDKFEALYRAIHKITKSVETNEIIKVTGKQYFYYGKMEFYYGNRQC